MKRQEPALDPAALPHTVALRVAAVEAVRRQLENGHARQALAPGREEILERLPTKLPPLPGGEIAVLHRRLGKACRLAAVEGTVEGPQLAEKDLQRPGVGDDMVQGEKQAMLLAAEEKKHGANEGPPDEIKRPPRLLPRDLLRHVLATPRPEPREIDLREPSSECLAGLLDLLRRLLPRGGKARPQSLMAPDDFPQGSGEGPAIERSPKLEATGKVVRRGARFETIEKPQTPLGKRERSLLPIPSPAWNPRCLVSVSFRFSV